MQTLELRSDAQVSENLVTRILAGDTRAESEMVERYQSKLFSTIYSQSKDRSLTEDVVQDTWLIAIEKVRAAKLRNKKRLGSFIARIGCYQLIMRYRERDKFDLVPEEHFYTITDDSPCPDVVLSNSQFSNTIIKLLLSLKKERDRELLARFYLIGDHKQELCEEYQLSSEHFDRVVFRARERFKTLWSERIHENFVIQ